MMAAPTSSAGYEVILADMPWPYSSFGTAKLPYETMSWAQIRDFDLAEFMGPRCVLFSWVTTPLLAQQMLIHEHWREKFKLRFIGVPYVWLKTRQDGQLIGACGPRATLVNTQTEMVVAYTNVKRGRPFPLATESQTQWIEAPTIDDTPFSGPEQDHLATEDVRAPRGAHSQKPALVRTKIEELFGPRTRLELFARESAPGWDSLGNQSPNFRQF